MQELCIISVSQSSFIVSPNYLATLLKLSKSAAPCPQWSQIWKTLVNPSLDLQSPTLEQMISKNQSNLIGRSTNLNPQIISNTIELLPLSPSSLKTPSTQTGSIVPPPSQSKRSKVDLSSSQSAELILSFHDVFAGGPDLFETGADVLLLFITLKIFIKNKSQNIWNGQTDIINRNKQIWQVLNKMDKNYFDLQIQFFNANIEYNGTYCVSYSSQMAEDDKIEQLKLKYKLQQKISPSKQQVKIAINCLIQKLCEKEVQWVVLSAQLAQISEYFQGQDPFQEMDLLLKVIVNKYEQDPQVGWLQLFEAGMVNYEDKLPKNEYKNMINSLTLAIANYTLKVYQENNNIKQSRQNYKTIQQAIEELQKQQKQLIKQLQSVQDSGPKHGNEKVFSWKIQISEHWRIYMDIVRSYAFSHFQYSTAGDVWLFYELILALVLDNAIIQPSAYQSEPIICEIIMTCKKIASLQIFHQVYHHIFHEICLFLRIYFYRKKQFLQDDSKIILPSPKYPLVNHCSLIMRFIQKQFTTEQISLSRQQKLDCLMLLTSIVSIKLPKSANYNQVLQFALQIALFIDQEEQVANLNSSKISVTMFYCGQLISMIMYTNIDWLIQFCRKCQEHIEGKYLKRVLQIYRKGLMRVKRGLMDQEHQRYIHIRYIFGFCGLLTVQKMDSCIEDALTENFQHVVRIIEVTNGWDTEQQENQFQEMKKKQQRNLERKQEFYEERMYLNTQKEEKYFQIQKQKKQKKQKEFKSDDAEIVLWDEQFYHKNSLNSIDDEDEIEIFKKSMKDVQNHNPELYGILLHNFTQKQMLLWVVELEEKQDDE